MTIYLGHGLSKVDIEREDIVHSLEVAKDVFEEAEELKDLVSGITDLVQDLSAIKGCLQIESMEAIKDAGAAKDALNWLTAAEKGDYEDCLARGENIDTHPFVLASRALGIRVHTLAESEPLTPCVDATLAVIFAAASTGEEVEEIVEQELGRCGVSALCIMASEIPDIATSNECPDDGMAEECIGDMLENRLRYWFKARCRRFDFWLSVYLARAGIEADSTLADGTPLCDVCRRLIASSRTNRERVRSDLILTRERGDSVLRYFDFAAKFLT